MAFPQTQVADNKPVINSRRKHETDEIELKSPSFFSVDLDLCER